MVHDKTTDELRVSSTLVLHFHDLNHVQVNGVLCLPFVDPFRTAISLWLWHFCSAIRARSNGQYGIDHTFSKLLRKLGRQFRGQSRICNRDERCTVTL